MILKSFFHPESVAVVGASTDSSKVGHQLLSSIISGGYEGEVYPVNPRCAADGSFTELQGLKCYPDLPSIGEVPGLVIIAIPAGKIEGVLRDCARLKVTSVAIISAGFREAGPEGGRLEQEIVRIARGAGIRILGPNCLGLMSPWQKLNASFAGELPPPGGIAYFSQSGSLLAALLDMAVSNDIGFSKLASIGNKADIDELDMMKAFGQDPDTKVIAGYLENIDDGDAFAREAERISHEKPVLLVKSGVTGAGARAASQHTGGASKREIAYECVFERAGIIACNSITDQFNFAQAFAYQPLPASPEVAIVANAGGPGIMAADAIERQGLSLAEFSAETVAELSEKLPPSANVHNPVDLMGDARCERFELALKTIYREEKIAAVVVVLSPHTGTDIPRVAQTLVALSQQYPAKTTVGCFLGASKIADAEKILRKGGIPSYHSPEDAVGALRAMHDYARWRNRPKRVVKLFPVNRRKVDTIISRHLRRGEFDIGEMEARDILDAYGFVIPKGQVATSGEQAASIADQTGYPVVLKVWSHDITDKFSVGGVKTGLASPQEVMDAFDLMMYRIPRRMPEAEILGVLVQETCRQGREVVLGTTRDPHFGPLMKFGMGGIMVEVLKDVAFYLAPLTAREAREMLVSSRTYHLLTGARGRESVDIDAVAEGLQRLSQLVTEFTQIQEMEINPYVVGPEGTPPVAVDASIRLAQQ